MTTIEIDPKARGCVPRAFAVSGEITRSGYSARVPGDTMESLINPAEGGRHVLRVLALVLLLSAAALTATSRSQPIRPVPQPTIDQLIADLGHPTYAVREKAQRELWQRGDVAIPALEKATHDENPEVVRRARELLDKFSWGLRPDSPPEVIRLLRRFQAGDPDPRKNDETRKAAVLELLKHGTPGVSVARALLGKDFPPEVKQQLVEQITALLRREVPRRLFDGKVDEAAELVALHAAGTGPEGAADYAVFQLLRDKLPAAIAAAETTLKVGKQSANQKLLLAHLYRAKGDWSRARAVAADLPTHEDAPGPIEFLREDEGDWGTLADSLSFSGMNHPDAVRLTMLRLAGREKEFDEAVRRLAKEANEFRPPRRYSTPRWRSSPIIEPTRRRGSFSIAGRIAGSSRRS